METKAKKVLTIDLTNKVYEVKSFVDLNKYIGGVGLGVKLYQQYLQEDPIIFSIGPLNGFFPFASKTAIILKNSDVIEDMYIGGSLSMRLKFCGIDALVLYGKSEEPVILDIANTEVKFRDTSLELDSLGLPGKRSQLKIESKKLLMDRYFTTSEDFLDKKIVEKNVEGISITGTEIYKPKNFEKYAELYSSILNRKDELSVDMGIYPSCSNCPMGCGKSKVGEIGGNILIHSLVACQFADKIYSDIGVVFSCLNVLGYEYTHEDIENLPRIVEETLKNIK